MKLFNLFAGLALVGAETENDTAVGAENAVENKGQGSTKRF